MKRKRDKLVGAAKGSLTVWSCDPALNGFQTTNDYVLGPGGEQAAEMGVDVNSGSANTLVWQHTNVWAAGALIATYDNDGLHFYFNDPLGTRRVQTDYAGVVEQKCQSLPFGDGESCGTTPTEHLFTGKERDAESGNDYFGARYYASTIGRFMSPDRTPFGIAPGDPQSWNLYSYARNKPTTSIDVGGAWWTPLHSEMIDVALNGFMSAGEILQLQHRQDVMDSHAGDMTDQRGHYMAVPGQNPQVAKENADNFIVSNIAQAAQGTDASGNMSSDALNHLGDAMHTLQDMTSPMHTSDDGIPLVWLGSFANRGTNGIAHWLGANDPSDSWSRFGLAIRLTLAAFVQANPVAAAKHGLNSDNFEKAADQRISEFVNQYIDANQSNWWSEADKEATRQCALGNRAACVH